MRIKKPGIAKVLAVFLVIYLFCSSTISPKTFCNSKICANFPKSLQIIGEEAFSGTALKIVIFDDELLFIGKLAFDGNYNLSCVYIPESVSYIGDSAIPNNTDLVINGIADSYVQKWAKANRIDFTVNDIWSGTQLSNVIQSNKRLLVYLIICFAALETYLRAFWKIKKRFVSMRPQDRPELYPINYRFP